MTGPEQRIQGYLAVIAGSNGIIWWVWPVRYHENWLELKKLAGEFKALSPILPANQTGDDEPQSPQNHKPRTCQKRLIIQGQLGRHPRG